MNAPITCLECKSAMHHIVNRKSAKVMGDEYYLTYIHCDKCDLYYEETIRDRFCGPHEITLRKISMQDIEWLMKPSPGEEPL